MSGELKHRTPHSNTEIKTETSEHHDTLDASGSTSGSTISKQPTQNLKQDEKENLKKNSTQSHTHARTKSHSTPGDIINEDHTKNSRYSLLVERFDSLITMCEIHQHDDSSEHLICFVNEVKEGIYNNSKDKVASFVKYLESTNLGQDIKDLDLIEKLARGVDHVEMLVETSRMSKAIQHAVKTAYHRCLTIEELPVPWRENPHILSGYRFCRDSKDCVKSIFRWHNETTNIWTHLLGAVFFVCLGLFHLPTTAAWQQGTWLDRMPMIVFLICGIQCLLCSVIWHSFCGICHLNTKRRMVCFDYTGIVLCICASIMTTEYSILKCHPYAQAFYMTLTTLCSVFGIVMSWHPSFDTTGARAMRAVFFCSFALFGGLGGLHATYYRGVMETLSYYVPVLKSLLCYGCGVIFYASLFPERFIKHKFDYCGMSHNIWHLFVVGGIYYHYQAMIQIFERAIMENCSIN